MAHPVFSCFLCAASLFAGALLLTGCGSTVTDTNGGETTSGETTSGSGPSKPPFVSGTRLRAIVEVGAEDAEVFIGWHDSLLDEDCDPMPGADWKIRCLPGREMQVQFSDPACTQPVAILPYPPCSKLSKHAIAVTEDPSGMCYDKWTSAAYAVGAKKAAPAMTYSLGNDGTCVEHGVFEQYEVTPEDPASFVEMTLTDEPNGEEVAPQFLVGTDGSRQAAGTLWDPARKEACSPLFLAGDPEDIRCVPKNIGRVEGDTFSDASCTNLAGWVRDFPPCPDPEFLATVGHDDATYNKFLDLYETGPAIPAEDVFAKPNGGTCETGFANTDFLYYAVGEKVDRSAFGQLVYEAYGASRLQAYLLTAHGVPALAESVFWDSTRGETCMPMMFSDGVRRCVSTNFTGDSSGAQAFADPACTKRIVHVGPVQQHPFPSVVVTMGPSSCDIVADGVNTIGGPYTDKVYMSDGGCHELDYPYVSDYFYVGDALPFDTFVPVTRQVE